jgi:high-affinity iron transporter
LNLSSFLLVAAAATQAPAVAQQPPTRDVETARRVVAVLQLAAQEYALAWRGEALVNAAEWEEARAFLAEARRSAADLSAGLRAELVPRLSRLEQGVAGRMPSESLAIEVRAVEARLTSALRVPLDERPSREPSLASGLRVYGALCATCHGAEGRGDGAAAARLDPRPANLRDPSLLASTTPLDYYRRITHGVPATAMPAFESILSREERWDVVAHVFALSDTAAYRGRSGQLAVVFGTVRGTLGGALELMHRGDGAAAAAKVLDAYMAFEAVEPALGATEPGLVRRAEARFAAFRVAAASRVPASESERRHQELLAVLAEAEAALVGGRSAGGLFVESTLLLLREGVEAILVVGAIMTVLLRAGARRRRREVRWGVAAAIAASLLTAAALEWVFRVKPAQREALEGGVMLLAAAMLFYVSFWLLSKVETEAWTRFVKGRIQRAVASGSGIALAGVAFLAVYREGFETVLFYKALFVTGGADGAGPILGGMALAAAVLVGLFVAIERFGVHIPVRPFFAVTGATLAWLAFVFAGTGVKELQEGGYVATTPVPGMARSDVLGLYPTMESLLVQGLIVAAMAGALVWTFVVRPRRLARLPEPLDLSVEPPLPRTAEEPAAV